MLGLAVADQHRRMRTVGLLGQPVDAGHGLAIDLELEPPLDGRRVRGVYSFALRAGVGVKTPERSAP